VIRKEITKTNDFIIFSKERKSLLPANVDDPEYYTHVGQKFVPGKKVVTGFNKYET
jgi:hypothetical protein